MSIDDPFKEIQEKVRLVIEKTIAERQTPKFKNAMSSITKITQDYLMGSKLIGLMATRHREYYDNLLTINFIGLLEESARSIETLILSDSLNSARRELRFILEASVKSAAIDNIRPKSSLRVKLEMMNQGEHRPISSILENFDFGFKTIVVDEIRTTVMNEYKWACEYVHPTKPQVEERNRRHQRGQYLVSSDDLLRFYKRMTNVYDISLSCLFHGLGASMTGDIFVPTLDDKSRWKFHKTKYVSLISKSFDYKIERKTEKQR